MQKISSLFILLLAFLTSTAQGENNATGFDGLMRSDLKIYVVVAVLLIIFSGILLFLFSMERRLKALEG
jgi:hypothetical protein